VYFTGVSASTTVRIAILGAGFGGLGAALRLKQRGYHDFVVLEKADDLGGTWRDNSYPGCACDVPSHVYSYSFLPNPSGASPSPANRRSGRTCATAPSAAASPRTCATATSHRGGLGQRGPALAITTTAGDFTAQVLISAGGPLSEPALPKLPGLESFAGTDFPLGALEPRVRPGGQAGGP